MGNHPGGAAIWWQGGGRDITILYNISHPPRITLESHLAKYGKLVGEADGPEVKGAPEYDFQSPFWVELKIKCWEKLYDLVKNVKGYDGVKYYKVTYGEKDLFLYCLFLCLLNIATFMTVYLLPVFFQHASLHFWRDMFFYISLGSLLAFLHHQRHEWHVVVAVPARALVASQLAQLPGRRDRAVLCLCAWHAPLHLAAASVLSPLPV